MSQELVRTLEVSKGMIVNNRKTYTLEVVKTGYFTKNMFRVTFGGAGQRLLSEDCTGGYFKLRIPPSEDGGKTNVRTYTIRHHGPETLDIDFALHGDAKHPGLATNWALDTKPGDLLEVGGPGPAKPLPAPSGEFLLIGDMTALPAIGANLDKLGPNARGHAVIEIQHEDDKQGFDLPAGFQIHWLINPHPGNDAHRLSSFVRQLPWSDELDFAWVACEFDAMRKLRAYLRDERKLGPEQLYVSSYWKKGLMEDDHRTVKSQDAKSLSA